MPIYEYKCQKCDNYFEQIQKATDKPLRICPNCGKKQLKKLVSSTSFQLKGTGWYVTDFKNKKETKENKETKDKSKSKLDEKSKKTEENNTNK